MGVVCICRHREGPEMILLIVPSLSEGVAQPLQSFIETIARSSTSRLDVLCVVLADTIPVVKKNSTTYPGALSQRV